MTLQKVQGPECPECGCTACETVREVTSWGRASRQVECNNCGRQFTAPLNDDPESSVPIVRYPKVHVPCPYCGTVKTKTTSSPRPAPGAGTRVRYHKCMARACGKTFKSVE